eukprot:TRINITY_DN2156_c0_g2_i1.p1 TRINITY_DN2156_c0_g2~~TRINITY_DN2156_c0_g2_i1.p1  ORF type:complete len:338 (-),score=105.59 TRINITY_DN2156_c0_g2_i1:96-1109(-)
MAEAEIFRRKYSELVEENNNLQKRLALQDQERQNLGRNQVELESSSKSLIIENERLNRLIRELVSEKESLKSRIGTIEATHRTELERYRTTVESTLRAKLEKETTEVIAALTSEKTNFESELSALQLKNQELEAHNTHSKKYLNELEIKVNLLASEVDRMGKALREKDKSIESMRSQMGRLSVDKSAFENQVVHLNAVIREMETKVQMLLMENEKTVNSLKEKVKEIELMRSHVVDRTRLMQFDEMKRQLEQFLRGHYEAEAHAMRARFANEKALLDQTIVQLREQLQGAEQGMSNTAPDIASLPGNISQTHAQAIINRSQVYGNNSTVVPHNLIRR